MARPQRQDLPHREPTPSVERPVAPVMAAAAETTGQPSRLGGQVGLMHDDLARRLGLGIADLTPPEPAGERALRTISAIAGYGALVIAYAGAALIALR